MQENKINARWLLGIDEAGRGPLAGPLAVAGVLIPADFAARAFFRGIRDSKQLTEKKREGWYTKITAEAELKWAVVLIAPEVIDEINIASAAREGAYKVYKKLSKTREEIMHVLLDGSLYLPRQVSQETIIKGDEKVPLIAAASIIAKVTRDRIMRKIHKKYPHYLFHRHKGYATLLHRQNIVQYGLSPAHRVSFCRKFV